VKRVEIESEKAFADVSCDEHYRIATMGRVVADRLT
jgi:hypothetical protein